MQDEEESEAAKLEVKITECKKIKISPQTVARFRKKILFDKCRGSRSEQFKSNEANGFNCQEN